MLRATAGLCALLPCVYASILVYTQTIPHGIMAEYPDMPAEFGGSVGAAGLRGLLALASPRDACAPIEPPPAGANASRWIALVARSGGACTFEAQVRHVQAAGFHCAIVHNVNSSELEVMTAADGAGIAIPAVFAGAEAGLRLAADFLYDSGFYVLVDDELPFDVTTHLLLPFAAVVGACLLVVVAFLVVKCVKERRRARRHRLPSRALDKILTWRYSKGDPYDTCAICLDDYREGERLRVLACAHAYHAACVDPWLTRNRRVCPVCKRRVRVAGERSDASDESDAGDDAAPLLPRARVATRGGTFDDQSENPFARARRFVARLRASQRDEPAAGGDEEAAAPADPRRERRRRPAGRPRRGRRAGVAAPADQRGEIGVAALPAPSTVSL